MTASEEDSTMSAYEKAMQKIVASTPQQPAAREQQASNNAMSAYEMALRQMSTQNNTQLVTYSRDENENNAGLFVEAAFNDETFSAQKRNVLQTAGTWTNYYPTATPPSPTEEQDTNKNGNDYYDAGRDNAIPFQTPPFTEDPRVQQRQDPAIYNSAQDASFSQQQQQQPLEPATTDDEPSLGFLQALEANSGTTRQGILTTQPIAVTQIPSETESSNDIEGGEWIPPLMFVTKDDPSIQSLYSSKELDLDPPTTQQQQSDPMLVPSPEYEALASMYRIALNAELEEETAQEMPLQNAYFDPSADVQESSAQQSTQGPEVAQLPQPSTEYGPRSTAEPESPMTSPANFVTINPQLNNFMNTAWEESDNQRRKKMDPVKTVADFTKDVLGIKRPDSSDKDKKKAPFAVKPGVTKRILQAMDAKEPA
jgi:hypothetical protein